MFRYGVDDGFIIGLLLVLYVGFGDGIKDIFIPVILIGYEVWFKYGIKYGTVLRLILESEYRIKVGFLLGIFLGSNVRLEDII